MSDYSDNEAKRRYELKEKQRLKNIQKNAMEMRSMEALINKGKPLAPKAERPKDMQGTRDLWKEKNLATNLEHIKKITPDDTIGIDPNVRNKSKFFRDTTDKVADAADEVDDVAKLAKNSKGFAKLIPLLGLGTAGLAASSIFNKAKAGDVAEAGTELLDEGTDLIPGIGQIKQAITPTEMGKDPLEPVSLKGSVFEEEEKQKYKTLMDKLYNRK